MELKVNEVAIPEQISFNYEELKQELSEKVSHYETLVYTDAEIKTAKTDRSSLNKLKKALNDERTRREKEYMKPFNEFKAQINDIISIIDKPIGLIDKQVKEYEEKCRNDRRKEIENWFKGRIKPEWLDLSQIWDDRWLNASTTKRSIQDNIDGWINRVQEEIKTLETLPKFSFEAIETYKNTLDINKAISEGKRLVEIQKRKEEAEKLKAEQEEKTERELPPRPIREPIDIPMVEKPKEEGQWVNFSAKLTVSQAKDLKQFFELRNIEFKPI